MASTNQCLLLIDDIESERLSIATYLQGCGYIVLQAESGQQGLEMLLQYQPDVVLCDLLTPCVVGSGLLKKINDHQVDVPVIVLSRKGVMSDVVDALRMGATDYLIKPIVDMAVLQHAVERCLEQGQLRRQNREYRLRLEQANRGLQQNLRILKQDQLIGRQVQLKMVPTTPQQFGEYHFSHKIVPSLYLSGDFIDYFTVGDNHVVFLIADVSGHGASSAFVTVLLKNMFARKRSDFIHQSDASILSPVGMLQIVNRNLLDTEIGKHATMCIGVLDLNTNTLCYSVAGHLPLPIMVAGDDCYFLTGEGMPVGLFESAMYTEKTVKLPDQFILALFSDGILEVVAADGVIQQEAYMLERFKSAPATIPKVISALELEHVVDVPDDIALLLISKNC